MKANSKIKSGKRQGNPGYRTSATFRGDRTFDLPKGPKTASLTKKPKTR